MPMQEDRNQQEDAKETPLRIRKIQLIFKKNVYDVSQELLHAYNGHTGKQARYCDFVRYISHIVEDCVPEAESQRDTHGAKVNGPFIQFRLRQTVFLQPAEVRERKKRALGELKNMLGEQVEDVRFAD